MSPGRKEEAGDRANICTGLRGYVHRRRREEEEGRKRRTLNTTAMILDTRVKAVAPFNIATHSIYMEIECSLFTLGVMRDMKDFILLFLLWGWWLAEEEEEAAAVADEDDVGPVAAAGRVADLAAAAGLVTVAVVADDISVPAALVVAAYD